MNKYLLIGLLILSPSFILFGADKQPKIDSTFKSINISPSIVVGSEIEISFRGEFENSERGKLLFSGTAGLFNFDEYIMLDIGLGYGYPIKKSANYKIYLNGLCTYNYQAVPTGLPNERHGVTGLVELEFLKTWNKLSLSIAPFYRRSELKGITYFSDKTFNGYNSVGVRIGMIYRFKLNK